MATKASRHVDTLFAYRAAAGGESKCRLRIFRLGPDRPAVVVATELPTNPGRSVTNAAEVIATAVVRDWSIDPDCLVWVEHHPTSTSSSETFRIVRFLHDPATDALTRPAWHPTTRAAVEHLVGGPLAP